MILLAIDPGNEQSACVTVNTDDYSIVFVGKHKNDDVAVILQTMPCNQIVIEMIASYGMAVGKEVFETCVIIGEFKQLASFKHIPCDLVYRKDVKLNLCGSPRAKDSNIIQALKDRFGDKGTRANPGWFYNFSKDVWQAYALAVTWIDEHGKAIT